MKYILVFLFLVSTTVFSQKTSNYNRAHVAFTGCEAVKDTKEASACYKTKMRQYIDSSLTADVSKKLIQLSKKDTLQITSRLYFNEEGSVVKRHSKFWIYKLKNSQQELDYLVDNFPEINPVLDKFNNGVANLVTVSFNYKVDRVNNSLIHIKKSNKKSKPKGGDFEIIEHVPLYKGCSKKLSNKEAKNCMNVKIREHVGKNFRTKIAAKIGLSPGIKKIYVSFKIDKKGKPIDIKAIAPHPHLEVEAIRVIKLMPKMKSPGMQRGKPVIVPYALPITFMIE